MIQTQAYRRGVSKRQPGDLCMDQEKSAYPEDSEVFSTAATFAGLGLSESSAMSFRAHKSKVGYSAVEFPRCKYNGPRGRCSMPLIRETPARLTHADTILYEVYVLRSSWGTLCIGEDRQVTPMRRTSSSTCSGGRAVEIILASAASGRVIQTGTCRRTARHSKTRHDAHKA